MNKINELSQYILDLAMDDRKFKNSKLTNAEFMDLFYGVQDMAKNGDTTTIQSKVKDVYEKYNFNIIEEGIGWRISID